MAIMDFIMSLLPRLNKSDVLEDLRVTKADFQTVVQPCYVQAKEAFKTNKLVSKPVTDLSMIFYRNYDISGSKKQPNFIAEIECRLPMLIQNLGYVEKEMEDLFERDIIREGLTARKAILIRSAEQLSFVGKYATDLLTYVYLEEARAANPEVDEGSELPPGIVARILKDMPNFSRIFSIVAMDSKVFSEKIGTIPEVVVNSKTEQSLTAVYDKGQLDPFKMLLVSKFDGSPIYSIALGIAEWQADRYKLAKDKKRSLELRMLHLKMVQEKNTDPKVESEIAYLQSRIDKLEYKMKKMEDSVS